MKNSYYQYRQKSLAERVLRKGFQTGYTFFELCLVAVYLRDEKGLPSREIRVELENLLARSQGAYSEYRWCVQVDRALRFAKNRKNVLVECDSIPMYKSEVAWIQELDVSDNIKRTLFAMMVQKKLDKASYEIRNDEPYTVFAYRNNPKRLAAMPRVAGLKQGRGFDFSKDVLHPMYHAGLISFIQSNGSPIRLHFADRFAWEGEKAVDVRDYEHLGLYWDYLNGGAVGFCQVEGCGFPFRVKATGRPRMYCDAHEDYRAPKEHESMERRCADCGEVFQRKPHAVRQTRCPACQANQEKGGKGRKTPPQAG